MLNIYKFTQITSGTIKIKINNKYTEIKPFLGKFIMLTIKK